MKKGLIAFAIFFGCVAIVAALDVLGLPIIPVGGDVVSPGLVLVTHLPAWLYLIFSKAKASSGIIAFCFELFARFLILESSSATVSVFNAVWWMLVISWLYSHEKRKQEHCSFKKEGEPCEFCAHWIAQNNLKENVDAALKMWEETLHEEGGK